MAVGMDLVGVTVVEEVPDCVIMTLLVGVMERDGVTEGDEVGVALGVAVSVAVGLGVMVGVIVVLGVTVGVTD